MKKTQYLTKLVSIAESLDDLAFYKIADEIDSVLESEVPLKKMYILRGISGSGKSTLAKELSKGDDSKVFSSDDFFMEEEEYRFNPKMLPKAHSWNQRRVRKALEQGITPIIVDNTHTQKWEARSYVEMAREFGYAVFFEETKTPWRFDAEELAKKNVHGVPPEAIQRMIDRYEDHDSFTEEEVLKSLAPWEKGL